MTWTLQGMWVSMCLLCVLTALSSNSGILINYFFFIGLSIFIIGFSIEIIADQQKTVLEKTPRIKTNLYHQGYGRIQGIQII